MPGGPAFETSAPSPTMPASLAISASAPAANDFIGSPGIGMLLGAHALEASTIESDLVAADPMANVGAVGSALRALSPTDAASVLDTLATQAAALSLVLAADAGGVINLPSSLRELLLAASAMPAFLGGAN